MNTLPTAWLPDRRRILVVVRDQQDFSLIQGLFREPDKSGYSLEWCATAAQGLAQLRRGDHDVYLLDSQLCIHGELKILEAIRGESLSRAVILLIESGDQAADTRISPAGISGCLIKSMIDAEGLASLVQYAFEQGRHAEALRDSEMRHRLLFEQCPIPLLIFDRRTLIILRANQSAQHRYGKLPYGKPFIESSRQSFSGRSIETIFAAEERARFRRHLLAGSLIAHGVQVWKHRRANGQPLLVEATFHSIRFNGTDAILAQLQDITKRSQTDDRLRLLERAIHSISSGVVIVDANLPDMPITYINRAFEKMTGYVAEEVIGRNCRLLQGLESNDAERSGIREAILHQREYSGLLRNARKDGTPFWNQLHLAPVRDEQGDVSHYIGIQKDVTEQRDTALKLAYSDMHDSATGLARYAVIDALLQEHARLREGAPLTLLYADIDRFHITNETMGHEVGDRVIGELAARFTDVVGSRGVVARFTGDEFVIALPGLGMDEATVLAESLRERVAEPVVLPSCEVLVTVSIGVASYPIHVKAGEENAIHDLLRLADGSMLRAKQQGRDMVCPYSEQDMLRMEDRRMLGLRLRGAMQQGELKLVYQPQISAVDGLLIGFEALLRWHSPEMGLLMPDRFIPVAEGLGLMPELGAWVLDNACSQSRQWLDAGVGDFLIAVNVSAQQIQRGNLPAQVAATLARYNLPAGRLELEVTEGSLIDNIERALQTICQLTEMGVQLAFDDFGTGYSNLSYLHQFQVHKLKIDKSFVRDMPSDANSVAIASTVIAIGHQLHMKVVAEGVETAEQAAMLTQIGCDILQGYLISYPMSAADAEQWLHHHRVTHSG